MPTFPLFVVLVKDNLNLERHIPSHFRVTANFILFCMGISFPLEIPFLHSQPPLPSPPQAASLISVCTTPFPYSTTLIFPPPVLHPVEHTLACGSPSFTPVMREMSVSGDCKVTFRKQAYSRLSINQDKTEKITCAALLLSPCLYALGTKRISPTQPKIHSDAFCLAITNSLPSSTAVNSLDYFKQ